MSKKLLEEQAVRKFMKIAGLQPLANSFLKESEDKPKEEMDEAYGSKPKKMEERSETEEKHEEKDSKKLDEVEDLEESKNELEEGGGQVPFDDQTRREDERAPMGEAKKLSPDKPSKMKGAPPSHKMKPLKEEEEPKDEMADVEMPSDMEASPPASDLDVEALVKDLVKVITSRVPGAAAVISLEDEGDETEVEMSPEKEEEGEEADEMADEEAELDEASLQSIVAETVKRVKDRLLQENQKSVKKVVAKVDVKSK